jgi:hypothetical protein
MTGLARVLSHSYAASYWLGGLPRRTFPPSNIRKNFPADLVSHFLLKPCSSSDSKAGERQHSDGCLWQGDTTVCRLKRLDRVYLPATRVYSKGWGPQSSEHLSRQRAEHPWNPQSGGSPSLPPPTSQANNGRPQIRRRSDNLQPSHVCHVEAARSR